MAHHLRAGIIGGMGPAATLQFYELVLDKTRTIAGALTDQHHISAAIEMNPTIVDRQKAIISGTDIELCGQQLRQSGRRIRDAECDFAVCVCNSAHYFQQDMMRGLGPVRFVSIIESTANRIHKTVEAQALRTEASDGVEAAHKVRNEAKVGILAASGCVHGQLYQNALDARGIKHEIPDSDTQARCLEAIYLCKSGKMTKGRATFATVLDNMIRSKGVNMLILGCTELPLLMPLSEEEASKEAAKEALAGETETKADEAKVDVDLEGVTFFDANDILADTVVRLCTGDINLDDAAVAPAEEAKDVA